MDDQFKEYESGAICSMHEGEDKWYGLLVGTLEGKSQLGILDINGIIVIRIIKIDLQNSMGKRVWINLASIVKIENPAVGEVVGSCEDGNEHLPWEK